MACQQVGVDACHALLCGAVFIAVGIRVGQVVDFGDAVVGEHVIERRDKFRTHIRHLKDALIVLHRRGEQLRAVAQNRVCQLDDSVFIVLPAPFPRVGWTHVASFLTGVVFVAFVLVCRNHNVGLQPKQQRFRPDVRYSCSETVHVVYKFRHIVG